MRRIEESPAEAMMLDLMTSRGIVAALAVTAAATLAAVLRPTIFREFASAAEPQLTYPKHYLDNRVEPVENCVKGAALAVASLGASRGQHGTGALEDEEREGRVRDIAQAGGPEPTVQRPDSCL